MDSVDVNDTYKRPISLQKHLYLVCQDNLFCSPKIIFLDPNGFATHSLRSPGLEDSVLQSHTLCDMNTLWHYHITSRPTRYLLATDSLNLVWKRSLLLGWKCEKWVWWGWV